MTFSLEIATRGAPQIYDSLDVYISSRYRILIPRLDLMSCILRMSLSVSSEA